MYLHHGTHLPGHEFGTAEAEFLTWRGLRPLEPHQRARAARVVGLPADEVRGALPLR